MNNSATDEYDAYWIDIIYQVNEGISRYLMLFIWFIWKSWIDFKIVLFFVKTLYVKVHVQCISSRRIFHNFLSLISLF